MSTVAHETFQGKKGVRNERPVWKVKKITAPTQGVACKQQSFPKAAASNSSRDFIKRIILAVVIMQQNLTWAFISTNSSTKALGFAADLRHGNAGGSTAHCSPLCAQRCAHNSKTWPTCALHFPPLTDHIVWTQSPTLTSGIPKGWGFRPLLHCIPSSHDSITPPDAFITSWGECTAEGKRNLRGSAEDLLSAVPACSPRCCLPKQSQICRPVSFFRGQSFLNPPCTFHTQKCSV